MMIKKRQKTEEKMPVKSCRQAARRGEGCKENAQVPEGVSGWQVGVHSQ
jgi:hypothetical protein